MTRKNVTLDGISLTIPDVQAIAREGATAALSGEAQSKMAASAALVAEWTSADRVIYGVTTGFGDLATVAIDKNDVGHCSPTSCGVTRAASGSPSRKTSSARSWRSGSTRSREGIRESGCQRCSACATCSTPASFRSSRVRGPSAQAATSAPLSAPRHRPARPWRLSL